MAESLAMSNDVLNGDVARSWTEARRGNEYTKYPYPIVVEHLEEIRPELCAPHVTKPNSPMANH